MAARTGKGDCAGDRHTESPDTAKEPCCHEGPRCGHIARERNRYFTGKYMAARDFRDEQHYFLSRHRLHTRLLHGWGTVCGLTVEPHWDERCADRRVIVRRGIAVDCCGRELILEQDTVIEVWPEPDETPANPDQPQAAEPRDYGKKPPSKPPEPPVPPEPPRKRYLIYLRYCEEPLECVPALDDNECGCQHGAPREEANRIEEVARLGVMPFEEVEPDCWPVKGYARPAGESSYAPELNAPAKGYDDCSKTGAMPGCLEPDCVCDHLVPLALVTAPDAVRTIEAGDIDTSGQRMLRTPPEYLTHIADINWPHGGSMTLDQLRDLKGELRITFDRKIQPNDGEATGVNEHTFVVQYGGLQRTLEFLPSTPETPALVDEHVAVFAIEKRKLDPRDRNGNVAGNVVYITLKCDFILDCHGNPVDGNHARGQRPTGDGVKGGTFESWFRVTYD